MSDSFSIIHTPEGLPFLERTLRLVSHCAAWTQTRPEYRTEQAAATILGDVVDLCRLLKLDYQTIAVRARDRHHSAAPVALDAALIHSCEMLDLAYRVVFCGGAFPCSAARQADAERALASIFTALHSPKQNGVSDG